MSLPRCPAAESKNLLLGQQQLQLSGMQARHAENAKHVILSGAKRSRTIPPRYL
jgi:hypothetical protein